MKSVLTSCSPAGKGFLTESKLHVCQQLGCKTEWAFAIFLSPGVPSSGRGCRILGPEKGSLMINPRGPLLRFVIHTNFILLAAFKARAFGV